MKIKLALAMIAIFLLPFAAFAHHSFAAQFDASKPVLVQGVVAKVEWMNPHSWLHVDAKDENGNPTRWQCELASPNQLVRQGWNRNSVKVGDQLIIEGSLARNDARTCHARIVKTADGKRVLGESAPGQ